MPVFAINCDQCDATVTDPDLAGAVDKAVEHAVQHHDAERSNKLRSHLRAMARETTA